MIIREPSCYTCRHLLSFPDSCAAFPNGIPEEIQKGDDPHMDPIEGDNGIVYYPFLTKEQETRIRVDEVLKREGIRK